MTASQKPKTPSMAMKVREGVSSQDISLFCKRASRVALSQVVDHVSVQEELRVEGDARRTQFTVNIHFYPKEEYLEEHDLEPTEILSAFGSHFPSTLKREMVSEMKKLDADLKSQMTQLGQGKKVRSKEGEADDEDEDETPSRKKNDDEGSEVGDGDADDEKHARQKTQQATYSDDEDDEEEVGEYNDATLEAEFATSEEEATRVKKTKGSKRSSFKALVAAVSDRFQRNMQHCISFDFDETKCTFKLEACCSPAMSSLILMFSRSFLLKCRSFYLWASLRELVAPQ